MKKRALCLLLTAAMAVSMAACGGKDTTEGTPESSDKEETQQDTDEKQADVSSAEVNWEDPYEEPVTLTVGFEVSADPIYADGDDVTNNPWIRSYKERFNIEVVSSFESEVNNYSTKVNLAMAEGNLPDVFMADVSQLNKLIEADMIWDLTEVFDTYASDAVKAYMEAEPETYESAKSNGKLYGIPKMNYGAICQPNYVWIRKDWKESLGLEDPESMDDVVDIAKAFMEEYGSKGIAIEQTLDTLNMLAPAWGAYPTIWIEDENGEIVYGATQPEMKTALAEWAKWYQDGIIDANFVISDTAKIYEDIINGEFGVMPYYQWWGYGVGMDVVKNLGNEAYFEAYEIPSAIGEEVLNPLICDNAGYLVVSKNCEHPEAALKCVNFYAYMNDESFGVEDQAVIDEHTDNYMYHAAATLRVINPNAEYHNYVMVKDAWDKQDPSSLENVTQNFKYREIERFVNNGDASGVGTFLQQGSDKAAFAMGKQIIDDDRVIKNKVWAVTPETIQNSGSTLDDILTEGFTKIIMGEEPIDYFDTLIENWKAAGGDQATVEANEMYGN